MGCSLRGLYRDAGAPHFLGIRPGDGNLVARLAGHVAQLPEAAATELAAALRAAAERVWGGAEACAAELEQLRVRTILTS